MGASIIIGIASLAVGAVSTVVQAEAASDAAKERKEAREVDSAQFRNRQQEEIRKSVREERIRRAQILNQAENTGTSASSGAIGSTGALSTNLRSGAAFAQSNIKAHESVNRHLQNAADIETDAATFGAFANLFSSALNTFGSVDFHDVFDD